METPKVLTCSSPLKNFFITLHTLYKVSCQNLFIIVICLQKALNKNSLAVKKVRGQSEATMVISDQKL